MRILGIDPGSEKCGYGVIDVERSSRPVYVECGVLRLRKGDPLNARLDALRCDLAEVLAEFEPDALALERCFVKNNPHSALVLGEVRGLVKCEGFRAGVAVHEYQAQQAKRVITGDRLAPKARVADRLVVLLALASLPPVDATDALALAVTHAVRGQRARLAG